MNIIIFILISFSSLYFSLFFISIIYISQFFLNFFLKITKNFSKNPLTNRVKCGIISTSKREVNVMNNEIIKAMNRKPKKKIFRKWLSKNGYKVNRVIFFPIWIGTLIVKKIQTKLNNRQVWSEERAKQILDYYIPRKAEWCEEDKTFYFFDNGMWWGNLAKRYLKFKDRRWWNNNRAWCGRKIHKYLINKYKIAGFTKEIRNCSYC